MDFGIFFGADGSRQVEEEGEDEEEDEEEE